MTLQSTERLTVSLYQPAINNNRNTARKSRCHSKLLPAFLQMCHAARPFCTGFYDIQHLTLIGCQLLSKSAWRPSLRTDEREKQGDEKCQALKDKKISHQDSNDGVGQGGGSSERRQMSLVKINQGFLVNTPTKTLFPKLIMLRGVKLVSSHSF